MLYKFLAAFIGGGIGSLLRFLMSEFSKKIFLSSIFGTFTVNIIGCFVIGYLFGLALNKTDLISHTTRIFLTVGLLGGLTTFSSLNFEVFELIKSGKIFLGLGYMIVSCMVGLLATFLGYLTYSKI